MIAFTRSRSRPAGPWSGEDNCLPCPFLVDWAATNPWQERSIVKEIRLRAQELMQGVCRVCPVCNGRACAGEVPGMGGVAAMLLLSLGALVGYLVLRPFFSDALFGFLFLDRAEAPGNMGLWDQCLSESDALLGGPTARPER